MKKMTLSLLIASCFLAGVASAGDPPDLDMYGPDARALFFSLSAISKTGGKINREVTNVKDGVQTVYWTDDNTIRCTQVVTGSWMSFRCATKE